MSSTGHEKQWRHHLRLPALVCCLIVLTVLCTAGIYASVLYWQGRDFLRAMYSVRVGSSSSLEAITLARQFHATAYRYNGGLSNPGLGRDYIELPRCATVDCIIA